MIDTEQLSKTYGYMELCMKLSAALPSAETVSDDIKNQKSLLANRDLQDMSSVFISSLDFHNYMDGLLLIFLSLRRLSDPMF